MYSRTAAFDTAIVKNHVAVSSAQVYAPNSLTLLATLNITDGQVTVDDVPIRRRCQLTLADPTGIMIPDVVTDVLHPSSGNEIRLFRGIKYIDGTQELLPVGVFGIDECQIDDSGEGLHFNIIGYDRAKSVSDADMANEYVIAAGTNYKTAIQNLLSYRYPSIPFSDTWINYTTAATTPQVVLVTGDDPWNKAQKMALEGLAADLYFDTQGNLTIVPISDPTTQAPVWNYAEGPLATILYINKNVNVQEAWNHIIVFGEHPDNTAPIRGEAYDSNPLSPTYIGGPYGDRVKTYEGQQVTTTTQANAWAQAILNKSLGVNELVRFNALVHPAHEVGDVISIVRSKSKINAVYVVDKLTIPLVPERPMDVATRRRKL